MNMDELKEINELIVRTGRAEIKPLKCKSVRSGGPDGFTRGPGAIRWNHAFLCASKRFARGLPQTHDVPWLRAWPFQNSCRPAPSHLLRRCGVAASDDESQACSRLWLEANAVQPRANAKLILAAEGQ